MRIRRFGFIAILAVLSASPAVAQQANTALVVGSVVDSSGGALPGATATLTHVATNTSVEVVTDDRGQYRTPPLRIGDYEVAVQLEGFRRFVRRGIVLNIGDVRNVDVTLELGSVAETITVDATPPPLNTSDSTVGTVITNQQITALPLNGRDYLQLASLSAGTGPASGTGVVIGGQSANAVAFLLDGQDNNSQQMSIGHSNQKEIVKPSVDAIQEFKVVTNGYSAEYGRSSSGVVSVSLKSGTNQVNGTLYEFFRDDSLNSKNAFANNKPPDNRHQFGGAVGFPIVRNKTFFFGDSESGVIRRESATVSTLPLGSIRGGQFARTITDPLTRLPFANNAIPDSRIDPAALRILGYVPLPQTDAATNNFVYNSPSDQDERKWDIRVDQVFSGSHNLYLRASSQVFENKPTSPLPADQNGNYFVSGASDRTNSKSWVVTHNAVWSPSLIGSIRVGYNRLDWDERVPDQALRGVGIPGVNTNHPGFSQIAITGYRTLGVSNVPNDDDSRTTQVSGDLSWTRGGHTVKTGVQAYRLETDFLSSQRSSGIFNFNGQYTGDPFADFLLGYASSASLSTFATMNLQTNYTHVFVQDDWRVTPRLTLNLGLRYEYNPPSVDANDAIANFDLDSDPANPRIVLAGADGDGVTSRALVGANRRQFAPRAGFAYALPGERTVIRGGAGIFYGNMITVGGMSSLEINPPNHVRISQTTDRTIPTIFLSQGFAPDALSPARARDVNLVSWDRSDDQPTAYQWNANVQRELPGRLVVEVGYNFNRFVNNWRSIDGNPASPGPGNLNSRRQYQSAVVPTTGDVISLANVTRVQKDGWSQYHGLQTKVEKRYAKGIAILGAYTWSRTRGLEGGYQDFTNIDAEVAPTAADRRHHFVASGVYELPFGPGRRIGAEWSGLKNAFLGGWSLSPILTVTSGAPLNLSVNGNPSNSSGTDRPDVVGDWRLDNPTADRWFNTDAFVANQLFAYGNAPRNLLRGPGYFNVDLSLRKSFEITDGVRLDVRFESFNLTNAVNLDAPNTTVGNINFGRISSAGPARQNQIAVKLIF